MSKKEGEGPILLKLKLAGHFVGSAHGRGRRTGLGGVGHHEKVPVIGLRGQVIHGRNCRADDVTYAIRDLLLHLQIN